MRSDTALALLLTVLTTLVVTDMTCYRCMDLVVDNENITVPDVSYFIVFSAIITFQDLSQFIAFSAVWGLWEPEQEYPWRQMRASGGW